MHIVRDPEADATLEFLKSELAAAKNRRGHLIQIVAACTIQYTGRAASTLDQGERLIILKPDGTLLVHTSQKSKPVNWMPPGANTFTVAKDEDAVVLVAERKKPHHETVRLTFTEIRLLVAIPLRDSEELVLRRTEGDMHRLFFEHPDLIEAGITFQRGEKQTRRGPVDLWGTDKTGTRVLVEVKRSKAGISEATQLWRYVEMERTGRYADGDSDLDAGPPEAPDDRVQRAEDTSGRPKIRGILVSPGLSDKALAMLHEHGLEHVNISWDDLLAHLDAPRAAGQATLGTFADTEAALVREPTRRTGKKRT